MVLHVANTKTSLKHIQGKRKRVFAPAMLGGQNRLKLGQSVSEMAYPSKEYHNRLANLDDDTFLAGNLKDVPMSKNVAKQCAHEYRQSIVR